MGVRGAPTRGANARYVRSWPACVRRSAVGVVAALVLLVQPHVADATVPSATLRPWLFVSDIHLDPTGENANGKLGQDTNPQLFDAAIAEMQRADPDPPVVVLDGDFLSHILSTKLAVPTIRLIARRFARAFPRARFVLALGNEDSNCGDYRIPAGTTFLREVADAWAPLIDRDDAAPHFRETFVRDGFYETRLPLEGVRALVLDDVFWSPRYQNACGGTGQPALATIRSLDAAFRGRPQTTWVFVHIPPGVDAYSTAHLAHGLVVVPFLNARAKDVFIQSVTNPAHRVTLIISSHTHKFSFRIASRGRDAVPELSIPSVSPIFRNAPSFLTVHVNAAGTIVAADDWTQLSQRWADRGGLATLGMHAVSVASIRDLQRRLVDDPVLRSTFAALYNGGAPPEITPSNWRIYWCATTELTSSTFRACTAQGGFSIFTRRGLVLIGAALAAVVALAIVAVVALRRGRTARRAAP
jgi:sphingomyelin phosphodiesterase acid-like 3